MAEHSIHISSTEKNKAIWGRCANYRAQAINYIKSKNERLDVYNNESLLSITLALVQPTPSIDQNTGQTIKPGSALHRARYTFDNFKDRPARKPYPNHAHHMIPANSFFNKFEYDQQELLKKISYDVNNGNNLIFLPAIARDCKYHRLPWHETTNGHSNYSTEVKESAITIEQRLNEIIEEKKKCTEEDNVPNDLPKQLQDLENILWNIIINAGTISLDEIKIIGMEV